MKNVCSFLIILLTLMVGPALEAGELLAPGDAIIAVDPDGLVSNSDYPTGEPPAALLDGDLGTKYLNFGGFSRFNTGFIVTPAGGSSTIQSFQLSTANDAEGRDPASYELYGTNDAISSTDNSTGLSENWTLISSGPLSMPGTRFTPGPVVDVTNSTAYSSYKMTFPSTNDGGGLMQISEVDLFTGAGGTGSDVLAPGDTMLAIQATPDSHYPGGESPSNLLDGDIGSKYLNFGTENSGFIVTPSGSGPVLSFEITTANDFIERDPASWELYGTNDAITSGDNSQGNAESWTLIDTGSLALSDTRGVSSGFIPVIGDVGYASYKMLFPTLKDGGLANSMQIAEVQFHDVVPEPATMALLGLGGLMLRRRRQ